jgi:hypothetical protein
MNIKKSYDIGDTVWIYGITRTENKLTKGKVIKIFDLSDLGYNDEPYYLIELPTSIEPLLEIRTWHTMSQDNKGPVGSMRDLTDINNTLKMISQTGLNYDEEHDPSEPTPDQIRAALEKSKTDKEHAPLIYKENNSKPKRRTFAKRKPKNET